LTPIRGQCVKIFGLFYLDEYTFLFNRRASKAREILFYGLLEQDVRIKPLSYKKIVGGRTEG